MVFSSSPLYTPLSLLFLLINSSSFDGAISSSLPNTTSSSPGLNTTITGVFYEVDPVTIIVAANQTEVYSWYPGGSTSGWTTFTLAGPTTFTTAYIDDIPVYYTYSTTFFTYSVPSGTISTESLLASVNASNLVGYLTGTNYPWEVETTFVLNGPTVFVTQGVIVLGEAALSPPYELGSAPASNLDPKTTSYEPAAVSTESMASFPTIFNPQPVSSQASSQPISSLVMSQPIMPIPATEPSPSRTPVPVTPSSSSLVAASPDSISTIPPFSVANPSAVIINSQTILLSSPTSTIFSTPISLASSNLLIGSSLLPLPSQPPMPLASLIAYGYTASIRKASEVVIGSQTAVIGGPAITISGAPISLAESGTLVSSSFLPISLTVPSSTAIFTIGSQALTLLPSAVAFASTTLTAGAPGVTIDGTPVSLGPSDLIIGNKTETLPSTPIATVIHTGGAEGKERIWGYGFCWWSLGFVWWGLR
jgi:hypothetical protein